MKKIFKFLCILLILFLFVAVLLLGYLGFIPGLSSLFGSNKPRDLGVAYSQAEFNSARAKSQIEYDVLPSTTPAEESLQTSGSRDVKTEFSSAEITALMNDRPWRYWPYKDVQVKFHADGSGEISGVLIKERLPGYGAKIAAPKEAVDFAMKFLPSDPVFYVKMKASLAENKVGVFDPQAFQIGRMPLPVDMFLSYIPKSLVTEVYAAQLDEMNTELSKVENKREKIIEYINQRLMTFPGFYARTARFEENKLIFEGTLPEKESTVR
ncbi:MAG TPA: hypothetical protein VJB91_00695 [Patescibacteria group bacterium]|nr:hypothetical protein [Patescibacteria group bacterium]